MRMNITAIDMFEFAFALLSQYIGCYGDTQFVGKKEVQQYYNLPNLYTDD